MSEIIGGGSGGGGSPPLVENTLKNILSLTPTAGQIAFATDWQTLLIADGTQWQINSAWFNVKPPVFDIGYQYSNRLGYGRTYISDKEIDNCWFGLGSDPGSHNGQLRFDISIGVFGAFAQYSFGAWHPIVVGLVLTETTTNRAITQQPIGFTSLIQVFNGDSLTLGLNGVPLVQGYTLSMGAYPYPQSVGGGTF